MDYCLDAGDGTAGIWTGPDELDLDGDGLFDDAFSDLDGDGLADRADLDLDDDGTPEAPYTDDGTGSWALLRGAPAPSMRWFGLDGAEHSGGQADLDGDGITEQMLDTDRNGLADRASGSGVGYADTDGDGRWDVRVVDADGDGGADGAAAL